jgi:hypothetical protein
VHPHEIAMSKIGWTCAAGLLALCVWNVHRHVVAESLPPVTRAVVVAELFTSEGCSSCPPADEVLSRLVKQGQNGIEVLALGEHVDYWDRLGWRDPFSSAAYSTRQSQYDARVFHRNEVYTPQLVIDGRVAAAGSDTVAIQRAIRQAGDAPKAAIDVLVNRQHERDLEVRLQLRVPPMLTGDEPIDVVVAVVEDNLHSEVRRGENRGRTLKHDAVVRRLTTVGTLPPGVRTFSTSASETLAPDWQIASIRVVSFLQGRESRRIVGAGAASVSAAVDMR